MKYFYYIFWGILIFQAGCYDGEKETNEFVVTQYKQQDFLIFAGYSGINFKISGEGKPFELSVSYQIADEPVICLYGLSPVKGSVELTVGVKALDDSKMELILLNSNAKVCSVVFPAKRMNFSRIVAMPEKLKSGKQELLFIRNIGEREILKIFIKCSYISKEIKD